MNLITVDDIQDFVKKLDAIELSGLRSQKHLEAAILVLEHLAEQIKAGRAIILEKE